MSSLAEYAKSNPPRSSGKCWVCTCVDAEEINSGRNQGVSEWTILQWLIRDKKYSPSDVTRGKLHYHFLNRHHVKGAK